MNSVFRKITLGESCKMYQPKTISTDMLVPNGKYLVYGANGVIGRYSEYNHEEREILMTCRGATCGTINVSEPYSWINGNAMVIHPLDPEILFEFLKYQLEALDLSEVITGAAQPQITRQSLYSVPIVIPSQEDQQRIVAELDLLSGIIEKKNAQLKILDDLAQSIYFEMFGDEEEKTPLSTYITELSGGKSLAGDEENQYKVLKTGAVTYDYFRGDDVKNLPLDYIPREEDRVKKGDLLISRMNTAELVGAVAYVWNVNPNIYLPDRLWRASLTEAANPIFIWKALIQFDAKQQIRSLASGTSGTMKNISKPKLLSVTIPKVSRERQDSFAQRLHATERQRNCIKESKKVATDLFASRLNQYFNV